MSSQIGSFLLMLLQQLPEMLVYLVGLVATLVLRRRAPVALSIATIGFGWLLLMTFVQPLLWQGLLMAIEGSPPERMATIFPIFNFVTNGLHAVGIGLVAAGVVLQRPSR